jgi:hypothetical protein
MINTLLNFGIPQGSNISPILFTLYVSEINKCLGEMENVQVSLFADDQLLAISGRNHEELHARATVATEKLCSEIERAGMSLVSHKTVISLFGKEYKTLRNPEKMKILGDTIEYSKNLRYLRGISETRIYSRMRTKSTESQNFF